MTRRAPLWQAHLRADRRGCSSMVEQKLPKLTTRVRFPSPAPAPIPHLQNHDKICNPPTGSAGAPLRTKADSKIKNFCNDLEIEGNKMEQRHVLAAFAHVRKHGFEPKKQSTKWDVIDPSTGDRFPPKVIRERAEIEAGFPAPRSIGGGWPTNDILNELGFVTLPKNEDATRKIEEKAAALSLEDLARLAAKTQNRKPSKSKTSTTQFQRSLYVSAYVKCLAKGKCDLCQSDAPFSINGRPFLECHHIYQLAKGGEDTIENCVALCPNCHRKMHLVQSQIDKATLKKRVVDRKEKI